MAVLDDGDAPAPGAEDGDAEGEPDKVPCGMIPQAPEPIEKATSKAVAARFMRVSTYCVMGRFG
jgi:hypothetical protein